MLAYASQMPISDTDNLMNQHPKIEPVEIPELKIPRIEIEELPKLGEQVKEELCRRRLHIDGCPWQ